MLCDRVNHLNSSTTTRQHRCITNSCTSARVSLNGTNWKRGRKPGASPLHAKLPRAKTMEQGFLLIDDLAALVNLKQPESIVSRTFFKGDRLKAILFGFDAGQEL